MGAVHWRARTANCAPRLRPGVGEERALLRQAVVVVLMLMLVAAGPVARLVVGRGGQGAPLSPDHLPQSISPARRELPVPR